MGSNFLGIGGNGSSSSSSSSSSRKGKKSNSDKPRQPQRGLGVAQLEKLRLHAQMGSTYLPSLQPSFSTYYNDENIRVQTAYSSLPSPSSFSSSSSSSSSPSSSSSSYSFHSFFHNLKMGLGDEHERSHVGYGDYQPTTAARWDVSNSMLEAQRFARPSMGRQPLNIHLEDQTTKSKKHRNNLMGASNEISESNETHELDLELRLSSRS